MGRHGLALGVEAEHLGPAAARADQPEEEPDGGGLPGAVRSEEAQDLTFGHLEVEVLQGVDRAVALGQALGFDCRWSQVASPCRPRLGRPGAGAQCRTTTTGQWALVTQCSETEPSTMPMNAPCPRLPTTNRVAPFDASTRIGAG